MPTDSSRSRVRPSRAVKSAAEAAPSIDLLAWYHLLREKLWFIALCVALALAAGAAYLYITPKTYTSTAVVQVEQEATNIVNIQDVTREDLKSLEAVKTVEGALTSRSLMLRVVRANGLDREAGFYGDGKSLAALTDAQLISGLANRVDIKLRRGTRLIDISVTDTEAERAARLARSFVDESIRFGAEQKSTATGSVNAMLMKQAEELKARLAKSEQALQDYREQHGTVSLEEKQNITADKLKEINKALQEARGDRIRLEADLPKLRQMGTLPVEELLAIQGVAKAVDVIDTQKLITAKESEFAQIKKRYLELHPRYIEAKEQTRDLRQALERTARKVGSTLANSVEAGRQTETMLEQALQEQDRLGLELSRVAIPYNALLRDRETDRILLDNVIARVKETSFTGGIDKTNIRLIEDPVVPRWPSKPQKPRILAMALLAGLLGSLTWLFLRQAFDRSLRSVDQAESVLGLSLLAAVPEVKRVRGKDAGLVLLAAPASREAEAFRCLRTSLSLLPEGNPKSILFTSAIPGEGKSFCAANCAVALAQQGLRVLLVDADLRRPGLSTLFATPKDAPGLSDVLAGKRPLGEAIRETEIPKLSLLPAGGANQSPAELLSGDRFPELITEMLGQYDRLVLDTAPINAVSDTLLFVDRVDATVFVVRARRTTARLAHRALRLMDQAGSHPAGFILNRLPHSLARYYYYDVGSYGSAGVYGTEAVK